jgi:hypothetical protein
MKALDILITRSTGFVDSTLSESLLEKEHGVKILTHHLHLASFVSCLHQMKYDIVWPIILTYKS